MNLCKQHEHNITHWKFILAELVQNKLAVLFLLLFCSENICPDRDGAGERERERNTFIFTYNQL